jgi:hypothetical protein
MTLQECKAMIAAIDAQLDDDSISDTEYDALDAQARDLIHLLPELERAERTAELPQISNSFVMDVCEGFAVGTHIITTRQYDTIRRISRCSEFCCDGYVINIAPGRTFCHLIKSKI